MLNIWLSHNLLSSHLTTLKPCNLPSYLAYWHGKFALGLLRKRDRDMIARPHFVLWGCAACQSFSRLGEESYFQRKIFAAIAAPFSFFFFFFWWRMLLIAS